MTAMTAEYLRNHKLVYRLRGKAREHGCAHCGVAAHEWATLHGADGSDPWEHYMPLCRSCHKRYDEPCRGRVLSAETRDKIATAARGRPASDTQRAAVSASNRTRIVSAETRVKLSEKASNASPETRAKISAANRGRVLSAESRAKISQSMQGKRNSLGRVLSAETRAKISRSRAGRV